jgi:hypothetical protein
MEILQKIAQSFAPRGRLLADLAGIAGRLQGVFERLDRHAEACVYSQMKEKIEAVAAATGIHVKELNSVLSDNRLWSRLPDVPVRDGSNTWERISGDFIALSRINMELNQQAVRWQGLDAGLADRLWKVIREQIPLIDTLQEVVARSDPQALD